MGQTKSTASRVAPAQRTRIIVADPYPVIVSGVRKMIEDEPRFEVVAEASTLLSFQKKLLAARPDVALLDWRMASQDLERTAALLASERYTPSIIFLTTSEDSQQKREMLRLGARAFISKWCSARKLRAAVWKAGDKRTSPAIANAEGAPSTADPEHRIEQLTHRERQLLPLVCRGLKNKEIALQLGISESTVWHHLTAVFTKLKVGDRLRLAAFVYSHRLVLLAGESELSVELFPAAVLDPVTDDDVSRELRLNA